MNHRWRWAVITGSVVSLPVLIGALGIASARPGQPINWTALYVIMLIIILLIDVPLIVAALLVAPYLERTYSRLLTDVLERSLRTTAHLFREQWEEERRHGTLPAVKDTAIEERVHGLEARLPERRGRIDDATAADVLARRTPPSEQDG